MWGHVPLLALFTVSPLYSVVLLQTPSDVAPFGQFAGLVEVLQQPVLLLRPRPLLSHFIGIKLINIKTTKSHIRGRWE